jgi:uncharacterized protein YndB with AHSA1/START domain
MSDTTAEVSRTISARPDEVWQALTTPETLKEFFFGAQVESEWRVGSPITFKGEHQGKHYEDKGEIRSFEPGRRLAYSHWSPLAGQPDAPENYHVVTWRLEPRGSGTKVTLTQANLKGGVTAQDEKMRPMFEKNWAMVLDGLAKTVGH